MSKCVDHYLLATACRPNQSFVYVQQIILLHPLLPKVLEPRIKNGFFFQRKQVMIGLVLRIRKTDCLILEELTSDFLITK